VPTGWFPILSCCAGDAHRQHTGSLRTRQPPHAVSLRCSNCRRCQLTEALAGAELATAAVATAFVMPGSSKHDWGQKPCLCLGWVLIFACLLLSYTICLVVSPFCSFQLARLGITQGLTPSPHVMLVPETHTAQEGWACQQQAMPVAAAVSDQPCAVAQALCPLPPLGCLSAVHSLLAVPAHHQHGVRGLCCSTSCP
jgi:hypothetical protein